MNDVVLGALIGAGSAIAGAAISQVGAYFIEKRRELASYRINLYEKRLEAYQKALELGQKLEIIAAVASPNDGLVRRGLDALDWYRANSLYLDPVSSREFARFTGRYLKWARGEGSDAAVAEQAEQMTTALLKGIGLKHIDMSMIRAEMRKLNWNVDDR